MSKTFRVIYDLNGLSDEQIEQYKRDVSEYYGLNPDENWFDVLWMQDPDTGLRRRQLYARRGTTDKLRDMKQISVTDMIHHDGPGFVSFTAKGKDPSGRTEMAVGAHSTEGLRGEKLAAAVSTAETRAGRRLTLKFLGMGILDYSEVTDPVEIRATPDIEPVAQAPIFLPQFSIAPTPNAAPGKVVVKDDVAQAQAEAAEISRRAVEAAKTLGAPYGVSQGGLHAYAEKMSVTTPDGKTMPPGEYKGVVVERGDGLTIVVEPGQSTVVDNTPLAPEAPVAPKTRRTRKKPNTVDISSPGQVSTDAETPAAAEKSPSADIPKSQPSPTPEPPQAVPVVPTQANPAVPTQVLPAAPPLAPPAVVVTAPVHPGGMTMTLPTPGPHQPILAPPVPAPATDFPGKPTKEQEATYREELRAYSNIILPTAGMVPSANIGGPSVKLRMYAERMAGKPTQQMTVDDWNDFFDQMKQFREKNGDKGLVKYINDVIGAK